MKSRVYILFLLLLLVTAWFRFNSRGHNLPEGCDVFGFMHMADAISNGRLFEEHTSRPFMPALIEHLESQGFVYKDYAWALAPHAYHVEKQSHKIINQYPPGTSMIMALAPRQARMSLFALSVLLFMGLLPGLLLWLEHRNEEGFKYSLTALAAVLCLSILTGPMLTEFTRPNSVAPTFGLLIASGIVFRKRPVLAIFILSLSMLFRVANVLLIPPMVLYAVFKTDNLNGWFLKEWAKRGLLAVSAFIFSGFGLYLIYVYVLLGNPFLPTYSEIDQRSIGMKMLLENASYYFIENPAWLYITLITVVLLTLLMIKKGVESRLYWLLISMPLIAYAFFLFHFIKTPYYPYAPATLIVGYLINESTRIPLKYLNASRYIMVLLTIVLAVMGIRETIPYYSTEPMGLEEQEAVYREAFTDEDVVWAELKSSTVEYATGIPGMRLQWAKAPVVLRAMTWFKNNEYKQGIMVSDLSLTPDTVRSYLRKADIDFTEETHPRLGLIFRMK
ncbi:MAG: hypothetical protein RIC15_07645 [Vicingaceae bacterium]